jgi:hypothetical protein
VNLIWAELKAGFRQAKEKAASFSAGSLVFDYRLIAPEA